MIVRQAQQIAQCRCRSRPTFAQHVADATAAGWPIDPDLRRLGPTTYGNRNTAVEEIDGERDDLGGAA